MRALVTVDAYSLWREMAESDDDDGLNLFDEPQGFYQPDKEPTTATHRLLTGQVITLRLVGHNPLWVGADFTAQIQNPCRQAGVATVDIFH